MALLPTFLTGHASFSSVPFSFVMVAGILSLTGLATALARRHTADKAEEGPPKMDVPTSKTPPRAPPRDSSDASKASNSTQFLASQVGGQSVINYSYTDFPWKLLAYDILYFFRFAWALPWIVWPLSPSDSGELDELSLTPGNVFCVLVHVVLCVLQAVFILSLPFAVIFPIWAVALYWGAFAAFNYLFCLLLNGTGVEYHSDEKYAEKRPEHAHERWIFLNGVAVGEHWMKNNLNRLALTFKRPILGIHNQTSGILFDVIECLVQRNLGYATYDVRMCYKRLKQTLYDPQFSKVVFILHSQGGIEGGLVLDWLLQELPQDLLGKLEVYTFGNAANHFNNPHRHVLSQRLALRDPSAAAAVSLTTTTTTTASPISIAPPVLANGRQPSLRQETSTASTTPAAFDRAIGHVEHYAHTTDFVAMWGVLHFCTSLPADHAMPRFIGRLFIRASDRGGHQFCQHYLDGMFPLARDPSTGQLTGAAEQNEFMDSLVQVGQQGDAGQNVREAFEITWNGTDGFGSGAVQAEVEVHGESRGRHRKRKGSVVRVKDLSRLWLYRNGRSPAEAPPLLLLENGIPRNATM